MENLNFTKYMIAEASALANAEGLTEDQAAHQWLKAFSSKTEQWFPKNCQISSSILSDEKTNLTEEQVLTVVTEDWPPFIYVDDAGEITGLITKRVKQLFADLGINYKIDLLPWNRAYQKAKNESNVAIYSIYRTEERENDFYWHCPLMKPIPVYFFSLSSREELKITSLTDLRQYTLGVTRDSFASKELKKQTSAMNLNINSGSDDMINVKTLINGRVDLILDTHEALSYRLKQWGLPRSLVKKHIEFKMPSVKDHCIAFNKGTSPAILNKLKIKGT